MSLQQWVDNAWITEIAPKARDVANLLAIAEREIADGSLEGMSPDGRFDHAYEGVRALCEAALHACGYQVPRGTSKHQRLIESLKFTIDADWTGEVDFLDLCRRRRHQSRYDRAGVVQQRDADELLATARRLDAEVRRWLREHHPELLP